ncbi:hypothetical protein L2E82_39553 [Cichorium intybus]|uniref:Uncharacterized protein n=1 Tax=Cichorium intybus TaxID=13427 RepID=A0ACB9AI13_CICIN|nr:hypothetical protein L2E82_39553 [Cichorium intybus]
MNNHLHHPLSDFRPFPSNIVDLPVLPSADVCEECEIFFCRNRDSVTVSFPFYRPVSLPSSEDSKLKIENRHLHPVTKSQIVRNRDSVTVSFPFYRPVSLPSSEDSKLKIENRHLHPVTKSQIVRNRDSVTVSFPFYRPVSLPSSEDSKLKIENRHLHPVTKSQIVRCRFGRTLVNKNLNEFICNNFVADEFTCNNFVVLLISGM